jgi:TolA-binding protein
VRRLGASLRAFAAFGAVACALAGGLVFSGCTSNSAKKQYLLAEKLWTDGKYSSAVTEFDKVTAKDPKGKLGLQALYRSATTQMLFQSQFGDAARKFKTFAEAAGADPDMAWDAQKQIGEIFYSKTEQYDRATQQYQLLLKQKPAAPEAPEFMFRLAKSHFFLWQFDDAVSVYREMVAKFSNTGWAEKASFEIGVTYFTRGEQKNGNRPKGSEREKGTDPYQEATDAYQRFIKNYPESPLVPQARFGIASCLEERDQLDAAYRAYESLKATYPSPNVIAIKLARIRERQAQRSH